MSAPARARPDHGTAPAAALDAYLDALARADSDAATRVAVGLLDAGVSPQDVLLALVGPAQVRVGRLWESMQWSVAQEHAATAISESVVAAVATRIPVARHPRGHVVLGCLDGEWHALPARIVGEVLRQHEWRVTYLGASVPAPHLVSYLHQHGPDVVALSCALPIHLPEAHRTIVAAQRTGTPVLAGGPGFGADGRWARRLGVDAWAASAVDAVDQLAELPWLVPDPDPAPHTGGDEYGGLRARRTDLVHDAARVLYAGTGPASPDLEDAAAHLVDFLAAATYLGDRDVFLQYLGWLADVASPRWGARHGGLRAALTRLWAGLHDFPFAQDCLAAGLVLPALTGSSTR